MADKIKMFNERMQEQVSPGASAKELVERIVISALEVEFGHKFTQNPGFSKMVSKLADAMVTNPELRRQSLQVAGHFVDDKNIKNEIKPRPIKVIAEKPRALPMQMRQLPKNMFAQTSNAVNSRITHIPTLPPSPGNNQIGRPKAQ